MKNKARSIAFIGLMSLLVLSLVSGKSFADCKNLGIQNVTAYQDNREIELFFQSPVTPKDAVSNNNPIRWQIIKFGGVADPQLPIVTGVNVRLKHPGPVANSAILTYSGNFAAGSKYALYVEGLTFDKCDPQKAVFAPISFTPVNQIGGTPKPPPAVWNLAKAKSRDDADIYVQGSVEGVRNDNEKEAKVIDLKIALPISRSLFTASQDIVPYVDLKASSTKKGDADALKLGVTLRTPFNNPLMPNGGWLPSMSWELDGRIESNKNLKFFNGIVSNTLRSIPQVIGSGNAQFYIEPFIGLEIGKNLRTPVQTMKSHKIIRPNVGASAFLNFRFEKPFLDSISLQSHYTRRWSLLREYAVEKNGDNYISLVTGKGPRDYVQNKLEFGLSDYVGIAFSHEYGRLPPNFKLLDNKFSIGVVYKSKILFRP